MTKQRILIATMFIYFAACSVVSPFMTIYLSQSLTPIEIGILMAVTPLCMILFQPLWGLIADRFGIRRVLMFALCMTAVSTMGFLMTRSFWGLMLVFFLYSLFIASIASLIDTLTLSLCGNNYGSIRLWGSIGYGIGVFFSGVFKSQLLGFWSFVLHMILLLVTLCIVFKIPEAAPKKDVLKSNADKKPEDSYAFLKNKSFLILLFSLFLIGVSNKGYDNFFAVQINNMKASDLLLGTTWIIEIIPEVILFYFLDKIAGKISSWYILIAGTMVYALRAAIIGSFPILWVWIGTQPLASLAFCCWYFGAVNLIGEMVHESRKATGQALFWSVCYGIGGITGSFFSGYIVNVSGIPYFFQISSILYAGAAAILCLLCLYQNQVTRQKKSAVSEAE